MGDVLRFPTVLVNYLQTKRRGQKGQCDYFAVFSEKLNKVYLISVDQVGTAKAHLRLAPVKENHERVRWAKDYKL